MSNPIKRDPILDQFSMITRPYTRLNGLKTIPFPAAHTRLANIRDYLPPDSDQFPRGPATKGNKAAVLKATMYLLCVYTCSNGRFIGSHSPLDCSNVNILDKKDQKF